jgi:tetratricopeptide (TPR) repeat protein
MSDHRYWPVTGRAASPILWLLVFLTAGCASEDQAWKRAHQSGSIEAYEEYLRSYPNGEFSATALEVIEALSWDRAHKKDTIEAYQRFLKAYPNGDFTGAAREGIATLSWNLARKEDTQQAYKAFLGEFPQGQFSDQAAIRSRDFVATTVGSGQIALPLSGVIRKGPVFEVARQWDARIARLDSNSLYAIDNEGKRISAQYLVPVNLAGHSVSWDTLTKVVVEKASNTFNWRYEAIIMSKTIGLVLKFSNENSPVRFGVVYDKDYKELRTLHILDNVLPVRP